MDSSMLYPPLPLPAVLDEVGPTELMERAEAYMTHTDPLQVNRAALCAGRAWAALRREAADLETNRKPRFLAIVADLVTNGVVEADGTKTKVTRTAAMDHLARADNRYTDYLDELREVEERRDEAQVAWECLHQRAALLAGAPPHPAPVELAVEG